MQENTQEAIPQHSTNGNGVHSTPPPMSGHLRRADDFARFDVLHALWRHKGKGLLWFFVVLVASVAAAQFWPSTYRSEAKLFVRLGRESVALDPTATIGETMPISDSRENEINSMLEIISSRELAERVVDSLGPQLILDSTAKPDGANESATAVQGGWGNVFRWDHVPITEHERAVTRLTSSLEAWSPKKTNVVDVRYSAATPESAQQILAKIVELYREEHVRAHRTERSYSFLEDQKRLLQGELQKAYDALRDAKNQVGLSSIDSQQTTLQHAIRAIDADSVAAHAELASSEARIAALKGVLDTVPTKLVTLEVGRANQAADTMRGTLFQLQAGQAEMQAKYTAAHPQLIAVNEEIHALQQTLDEQPAIRTEATAAPHPGHQQLELSWLSERASLSALQARVRNLESQHAVTVERIRDLNSRESLIAQAQRQVELLESNYRKYADKLEEARIDQQLESQQISNVNVIQPASYVAKGIPNRPFILMVGMFLAIAGGVAVCVFAGARELSGATFGPPATEEHVAASYSPPQHRRPR